MTFRRPPMPRPTRRPSGSARATSSATAGSTSAPSPRRASPSPECREERDRRGRRQRHERLGASLSHHRLDVRRGPAQQVPSLLLRRRRRPGKEAKRTAAKLTYRLICSWAGPSKVFGQAQLRNFLWDVHLRRQYDLYGSQFNH